MPSINSYLNQDQSAPEQNLLFDLAHLYQMAPIGLCALDRELRFVQVNERLAAVNGKPVDEHLGQSIHEILPDISQKLAPICRKVMETARPVLEVEIEGSEPDSPDDTNCWLTSFYPLKVEDGAVHGVGVAAIDITEHKKALRESNANDDALRQLMDQCPALIFIKDSQLRHIYGNPTLLRTFGRTLSEFVGTRAGDFFPPEIAQEMERADKELLEGHIPTSIDEIRTQIEGEPKYFKDIKFPLRSASGETLIGGGALDITDLMKSEETIREQLEFERLIADIAANLASVKPDKMEEIINSTLASLGRFLRTERVFIFQLSEEGRKFPLTNIWTEDGVSKSNKTIRNLIEMDMAAEVPWVTQQIQRGRVINTGPNLIDLSGEASELRQWLEREGINSGLVVPIMVEGNSIGALGLDTVVQPRAYPQSIVVRLRLVADMIGATLMRIRAGSALKESLTQVQQLKNQIEQENVYLREEIELHFRHDEIVGESPAFKSVLSQAERVAEQDTSVLILGETGTGKELLARAIHKMSPRSKRQMIKVNCAALPGTLIENELFGREKGAYTGAMSKELGRFEMANGSTIFLDEIGDMPIEVQAKLLRVLEEGQFERLGSSKTITVDVRLIAATNHDLEELVREGRFRKDLYYRLNTFPLRLPPIRERRDDIPLLVWAFVKEFGETMGKSIDRIPSKTMALLGNNSWPGNVRELRNVIERAMILSAGPTLQIDHLGTEDSVSMPGMTLQDVERGHILKVLETARWRVRGENGAASILNLKPTTLEARMKTLGIQRPQ